MRYMDLRSWSRREHFQLYSAFDHPHFGLSANVDLTAFYSEVKERGFSIAVAIVYAIAQAANAIPEFRHRIRGAEVVEHEIVHPSTTILADEDLFSFCTFDYVEDFSEFHARATERIAYVREHPGVKTEPGQDDLLYMTAIPWVSFTSFLHPSHLRPADSVPRFAWGKFFEENDLLKMPLSVQGHHALMDGVHAGKFYALVQDYFRDPLSILGKA